MFSSLTKEMSVFPGPFSSIKDKIRLAMLSRRPSTWNKNPLLIRMGFFSLLIGFFLEDVLLILTHKRLYFYRTLKQITVLLFKKIKKFIHKLCIKEFRKLDKMIQIKAYYDKEQKYRWQTSKIETRRLDKLYKTDISYCT